MDYVQPTQIWPEVGIRQCLTMRVAAKMAKGQTYGGAVYFGGRRGETSPHLIFIRICHISFAFTSDSQLFMFSDAGFCYISPPECSRLLGERQDVVEKPLWGCLQERLKAHKLITYIPFHSWKLLLKTHKRRKESNTHLAIDFIRAAPLLDPFWTLNFSVIPASGLSCVHPTALRGAAAVVPSMPTSPSLTSRPSGPQWEACVLSQE